jgi:hypothetical protein
MSVKVKPRVRRKSAPRPEVRTEYVYVQPKTRAEELEFLRESLRRSTADLKRMPPEEAKAFALDRLQRFGILDSKGNYRYPYDQ